MTTIYLKQWATQNGVPPSTAYRWFRNGTLPEGVHAERLPSGSIVVHLDPPPATPHKLVEELRAAGYTILTTEQARQIGERLGINLNQEHPSDHNT